MWTGRDAIRQNAKHGGIRYSQILKIISITAFAAIMLWISIGTQAGYTGVTVACISCHNDTDYPNDTNSDGIAAPYKRPHNDTVMCEDCHSSDPHNMTYLQPDGTYGNRSSAVTCPDCHQAGIPGFSKVAPLIPDPLKHSSNPANGSLWNSTSIPYWTSEKDSCIYCHGDTKHSSNALGKISSLLADPNNTRTGSLNTTTWCADCHLNVSNPNYITIISGPEPQFSPLPPLITFDNTGKSRWVNHSGYLINGYKDSNCRSCHALNGSYLPTSLNYTHSLDQGAAGNPNCIECHDLEAGLNAPAGINFTAANESAHAGMNSNNATLQDYAGIIGSCWACHSTNGNVTSGHPDKYKTPKICTECHLSSGSYYSQSSTWGGLNVSQHYYGSVTIKAGNSSSNISSCIKCHENVSEMILPNNDQDYGSFQGDEIRLTGGNMSFYHYGRPRPDLRVWDSGNSDNCSYCHQNASTAFAIGMVNASYSSSIQNHSSNLTTPGCTNSTCHSSGYLHNSTLTRPAFSSDNSSVFCQNCHSRQKHNGTVDCGRCHINTSSMDTIHPIKYIQSTAAYGMAKSGSANCTNCHQGSGVNGFSTAPVVPRLNHSTDPSSGRKWGTYWDNTTVITACYYCHQNEIHKENIELLGNVSEIKGTNTFNNPDLANSTWCGNCHYNDNSLNYRGDRLDPEPPEIMNRSGKVPNFASDGTRFYNHSGIENYRDGHCRNCHGAALAGYNVTTLNFSHSVSEGGGGPDCTSCHNISGTGAPENKRIDASAMKQGVHKNLNRNASTSQTLDQINKACWACHGDGGEPAGHPQRYRTPLKCSSDECHALAQSRYSEPMVYSHFMNASQTDNPGNVTSYNVTASVPCQACHINSLVRKDSSSAPALVSHYGSKNDLIDSFNCRYCHLDKDNSEDWGNAILINKNRTSLIELDREKNRFTVSEGERLYLGEGYSLRVLEISDKRGDALVQLQKGGDVVDEFLLSIGSQYKYEKDVTIDNSTLKTPVVVLNMTSIFTGTKGGFIEIEGFRSRKLHTERESRNNSACYACHLYRYSSEKQRYLVIDKESKEPYDVLYYTSVFVDFRAENRSRIYFNDEDYVFSQPGNAGKFISSSSLQKYLKTGETWNIADKYSLTLREITTDSKEAWLVLMINNRTVKEELVKKGSTFEYTPGLGYKEFTETNVTVFTAKIDAVSQGNPDFIILKDVTAISPAILKTTTNTTIYGYNASWFGVTDTFMVGRIPENLHSPNLFTDQKGWADCVKCHDTSKQLKIASLNAISSRLGKHSNLNTGAPGTALLSDPIDRACWACHEDGKEPRMHSPTYIAPRTCKSCHVYQEIPFFGAINISDEPHASETRCEACHISDSHNLIRFDVSPAIKDPVLSRTLAGPGESIRLTASANAGYGMKIRAAEYYIDNTGTSGNGTPLRPADGSFDTQKEEITGEINTTGLSTGEHVIYVHAMERYDRWGAYYPVNFTVSNVRSNILSRATTSPDLRIIVLIAGLAIAYLVFSRRRN